MVSVVVNLKETPEGDLLNPCAWQLKLPPIQRLPDPVLPRLRDSKVHKALRDQILIPFRQIQTVHDVWIKGIEHVEPPEASEYGVDLLVHLNSRHFILPKLHLHPAVPQPLHQGFEVILQVNHPTVEHDSYLHPRNALDKRKRKLQNLGTHNVCVVCDRAKVPHPVLEGFEPLELRQHLCLALLRHRPGPQGGAGGGYVVELEHTLKGYWPRAVPHKLDSV
mmetsp:Transcript_19395/g.46605  ORF Transcript_19395/g.46605 Transcript_19395/m.46605 type:complete len:221 (+) Transcript_19395:794-1456(+)